MAEDAAPPVLEPVARPLALMYTQSLHTCIVNTDY